MKKSFYKPTHRLSFKNIVMFAGLFVIISMIVVYAVNQNQWGYRSRSNSNTVRTYTGSSSFNSDTIEEWGECKTVTNTCNYDIFIPTKTSPEWAAFKAHHPACITLGDCGCVLKKFIDGVGNSTIQYSKFRNALVSGVNNEGNLGGVYGNFILGYGISLPVSLVYDNIYFPGRSRIASDQAISYDYNQYEYLTGVIHEFELYGISPDTENINRGCFSDGSYWVNSNVYSRQVLMINDILGGFYRPNRTTSRFGGTGGVNFGLKLNINRLASSPVYRYNRFFGCRSDLLPNPDKYCVERVIPKDATVPDDKPSAIYIKEFTNNYSFIGCGSGDACYNSRTSICSSLTGIANSTFRIMANSDIGWTGGLYDMVRPYYDSYYLGPPAPTDDYFYYRNTTGTNSGANYSTQIFGFYVYDVGGGPTQYSYMLPSNSYRSHMYDTDYYYYSTLEIGNNGDPHWVLGHQDMLGYNIRDRNNTVYMKIPLLENDNYLIAEDLQSFVMIYTGGASTMVGSEQLSKYICISHTCGPGYIKTQTGCTCPVGGCNMIITPPLGN